MYVCMKVSDTLELELYPAESGHVGTGYWNRVI